LQKSGLILGFNFFVFELGTPLELTEERMAGSEAFREDCLSERFL